MYWVFGLVLDKDAPWNAQEMMKKMMERNIGCRSFFYPMHLQPVFRKMGLFIGESYPVAENLVERGFYIPSGRGLTEEQRGYIAEQVRDCIRQ